MQKEILLITNYFPPEKGAAPNRMYSLAEGLGKAGYTVKVVCPLPNYPTGKIFKDYKAKLTVTEKATFGKITRLWVWPSNSANKIVRLFSMLSFSFSLVLFFIFGKTPKKIYIQYSPVFVGFTAVFLGRLFSKKIILNVSDLWPLAGLEMGILKKGWYYSLLLKMERYCYRNSALLIGQSEEILTHISSFEKEKPLFLYRNIPDFTPPLISKKPATNEIKIVYAGLLGVAQGLFNICQSLNLPEHISIHIYGAGPEAKKIQALQKQNIHFYGEISREKLHQELQNYDIAFIPLTKRIYGSVPSKVFEYTRLGLATLYFAGGEGGALVRKYSLGWVVPENNLDALQQFLNSFTREQLQQFSKDSVQKNSVAAFVFKQQLEDLIVKLETL